MSLWYESYINFPYKHLGQDPVTGIDCFNLCKLVFKNELDITIPYSTHDFCKIVDDDWYNKTNRQAMLEVSNNGDWEEVDDLEPFDIILMSIGSTNVVNHCALYLGQGKILQTMENRNSDIYNYHRYYQQYTVKKVRWKNLKKLTDAMNNHALKDYPCEAVGLITKDFDYIPCKNISDTPKDTFILDPAALVEHDENIWGFFHSHPGDENPIPSKEDKESAAFQEYKFLVGFNNNFKIYWYDNNLDALIFDAFEEKHLVKQD